jgi:membrane protease YdiL (CAAX protease family)
MFAWQERRNRPLKLNNATKRIMTYLIIVFAVSSIFYVLVSRNGGLEGSGEIYVLPLMWSPALAGLVTTLIFQRNLRGIGWGLGRPGYYGIAYVLPILYAWVAYFSIWLLGFGAVDTGSLGEPVIPFLVRTLTIHILGAALLALGEEIGWRGVLIPQLARIQSFHQVALISGVIWGVWHVPLILTGDYSSGAPAWFAIACFMVLVIGMSFAFAWLRLASGSIWPAVLMHATHNTFIQSVLDRITVDTGPTEYFTTEFGLGLAIMGIIVGLVFWRQGRTLTDTTRMDVATTQI